MRMPYSLSYRALHTLLLRVRFPEFKSIRHTKRKDTWVTLNYRRYYFLTYFGLILLIRYDVNSLIDDTACALYHAAPRLSRHANNEMFRPSAAYTAQIEWTKDIRDRDADFLSWIYWWFHAHIDILIIRNIDNYIAWYSISFLLHAE